MTTVPELANDGIAGNVTLRPYQLRAFQEVRRLVSCGVRKILVIAPTGAGKTSLAGYLVIRAVHNGHTVLFLAHRKELIDQAYDRFLLMGLAPEQVGVIMGNDPRHRPTAPVQIASVDTLRNRRKPRADIVIRDEAHRALSKTDRDLVAAYPDAIYLGLTATPYRADRKQLSEAFSESVQVATTRELIELGFLVEPRVLTAPPEALPDLSTVRTRGTDYDEGQLAEAMDQSGLLGDIVEHWLAHANYVRTVAFAVNVAHSRHIAERFNAAGVPAEHVDGAGSRAEREAVLNRLEAGETLVVSNCNLFSEGWDMPAVKCAILARPTKSKGLYLQQVGRVLRPYRDQTAVVLDHARCVLDHGHPLEDHEFSLKPHARRTGRVSEAQEGTKLCPACRDQVPQSARICPMCGESLAQRADPDTSEADGELVEVQFGGRAHREMTWRKLCRTVHERGFKPGWAYYKYKDKFGEGPPPDFDPPQWRPRTDDQKREYFEHLVGTESSMAWARMRYRAELREDPPAA